MSENPATLLIMFTAALAAVLGLRRAIRRRFGAASAYALWILPIWVTAAAMLPTWREAPMMPAALVTVVDGLTHQAHVTVAQHVWLPALLTGAWLAGALVMLVVLAGRHGRLRRQMQPLPDALRDAFGASPMQARRLRLHPAGPAVVWSGRSRLLLPPDFLSRFSAEQRRLVLAHEHTHLRHGDAGWNLLFELLLCALWFHPLLWWARARFRLDQEMACDDAVLRHRPSDIGAYARTLFHGTDRAGTPVLAAWLDEPQLKERLTMIRNLTHHKPWRRLGMPVIAVLLVASVFAAQAMAPGHHQATTKKPAKMPSFVLRGAPVYPAQARKKGLEGKVVVRLEIGANGRVLKAGAEPGDTAPSLVASALDAARQWRFNPATDAKGQPMVAWIKVPIWFSLDKDTKPASGKDAG